MKTFEFEDDFLGGQGPLSVEEEKAISEYLKKRKKSSNPSRLDRPVLKKSPKTKV